MKRGWSGLFTHIPDSIRPDEIEILVRVPLQGRNSVVKHVILGTVRFSWYVFTIKFPVKHLFFRNGHVQDQNVPKTLVRVPTYQGLQMGRNCVVLGREPRIQFHPALQQCITETTEKVVAFRG